MKRLLLAALALISLSGCGCKLDGGDSSNPASYIEGCWGAARRTNH